MKLGLAIGYSRAHVDVPVKLVQRAEELGYDSVWTAEAYGSDAVTPLAFLAAHTTRIKLGTGIMQLAGDGRCHGGRRAFHRRHRRIGSADRRRLVRPAMGQALLAHARLRRDHAQDLRARGAGHP
jgi:hypothetical protein